MKHLIARNARFAVYSENGKYFLSSLPVGNPASSLTEYVEKRSALVAYAKLTGRECLFETHAVYLYHGARICGTCANERSYAGDENVRYVKVIFGTLTGCDYCGTFGIPYASDSVV